MHAHAEASALPEIGRLTISKLFASLAAGWQDFRAAPAFGLLFTGIYVLVGMALVALKAGSVEWMITVSLGFPLVAPFAAVGLYEVSRRLEAGEKLVWRDVLGVVIGERRRQCPWIGAIVVIYFLIWTLLAHILFALIMGPSALINISSSLESLFTTRGFILIAAELLLGGILGFFLFSFTVVSLPLLLDREIDFVSAMLVSLRTVRENLGVMLVWALIIGALSVIAMAPFFLGLFIVLPVLGHATWHLYRRALYFPT
ncbi:MAG TPA: DUF2189 domain-containing protein [Rhodobacteraceae bacterium]|nr:DUF2189 domain-containing protein [Paracoccaceae bacterium]